MTDVRPFEVRRGDVVMATLETLGGAKRMLCRVWGQLRQTDILRAPGRHFVCVATDPRDVDAELLFMFHVGRSMLSLAWGSFPDDDRYMVVNEVGLAPAYDESVVRHFRRQGLCPRCGEKGEWVVMACLCSWHGKYLG